MVFEGAILFLEVLEALLAARRRQRRAQLVGVQRLLQFRKVGRLFLQ